MKRVGIPLVLHGASGIDEGTLKACVREGITKVNIYTDLAKAINRTIQNQYEQSDYVQIPAVLSDVRQVTVDTLGGYIDVLGATNQA